MVTRMCPYVFGMYAAKMGKGNGDAIVEYLAFLVVLVIINVGVHPSTEHDWPIINTAWISVAR